MEDDYKFIKLYGISLYFITNFLFAIAILFSTTSIQDLTAIWGFQALINLVIIATVLNEIEEEKKDQENKKNKSDWLWIKINFYGWLYQF